MLTAAVAIAVNASMPVGKVTEKVTADADVATVDNAPSTGSGSIPKQSLTVLPPERPRFVSSCTPTTGG